MKSLLSKIKLLTTLIAVAISITTFAQRTITGTVYKDGEPAAGVTVDAHKASETFMTSFDGKYTVDADEKSKYIKFTFIDDTRKLDIEGDTRDVIDFSFDGELPVAGDESEGGVDLRSDQELVKAKEADFLNDYTLYTQFYKQDDYESAMPYWNNIYKKYPKSNSNVYIQGAKMYKSKIDKAPDQGTRDKYVDSLMSLYDNRIKHFNQRGYVLGRKAADYLGYKLDNTELSDDEMMSIIKHGYNELEEAIELEQNNTEAAVLVLYMTATKRLFGMGEITKEKVAGNYGAASQIISSNAGDEKYSAAKAYVDESFQTSGAADCEALISLYEPQFDVISENIDDLKSMLRVLGKQKCTDSELYANASEKLYELDPSAEAAFNMARLFVKRDDFTRAKEYYQNAIGSETDKELLAQYYYELGVFTLAKESAYQKARDYARKALSNNPKYGNAYILLGDVYAQYAPKYGETEFDHKTMYWLAVDYFEKAKRNDPDVFQTANSRINTYKVYFPDNETMFMQGFTKGQTFTVESWINESTKARAK